MLGSLTLWDNCRLFQFIQFIIIILLLVYLFFHQFAYYIGYSTNFFCFLFFVTIGQSKCGLSRYVMSSCAHAYIHENVDRKYFSQMYIYKSIHLDVKPEVSTPDRWAIIPNHTGELCECTTSKYSRSKFKQEVCL